MEDFKLVLIKNIINCDNMQTLVECDQVLKKHNQIYNNSIVAEPQSNYEIRKPMKNEKINKNSKDCLKVEEGLKIPPQILEILKMSEKQIDEGKSYTGEEVEQYFTEWIAK